MWVIKCILNWVKQVDQKMIGLTEVLSIDSAVVGLAVHVVDQVHF